MAERYGVSRTPVREALRVLARESLLSYTPRSGYSVQSIDLDEMDDLYAVRIAIEEQSAQRLVSAGQEGILHNLLEFWGEMPERVAPATSTSSTRTSTFTRPWRLPAGSTVLAPMLETINRRLHVLRIRDFVDPERVRLTFDQHAAILRTLLAGDAAPGSGDAARPHPGEPRLRARQLHREQEGDLSVTHQSVHELSLARSRFTSPEAAGPLRSGSDEVLRRRPRSRHRSTLDFYTARSTPSWARTAPARARW